MDWVTLFFAIELGFAPMYGSLNVTLDDIDTDLTEKIGYVLFETEVILWDHLFIGGATKTYVQSTKNDIFDYFPFESDYLFNTGLKFDNLEIGWKHFCLHPTRPYEIYYQPQQSADAWYDEFYIRIEKRM